MDFVLWSAKKNTSLRSYSTYGDSKLPKIENEISHMQSQQWGFFAYTRTNWIKIFQCL